MTEGIYRLASRAVIDANGFELFDSPIAITTDAVSVDIPDAVPLDMSQMRWYEAIRDVGRNLLFDPPLPSGRYQELRRI